jgi:hypothetical protein
LQAVAQDLMQVVVVAQAAAVQVVSFIYHHNR